MAQFGEILAELRQGHGSTQKDLAKLFSVTPDTIPNYEKGCHLPDAEQLIEMADYFSVITDYLLGRSSPNLPVDVSFTPPLGDVTSGEMIQLIQALSPGREKALHLLLRDLYFSMVVGQYDHKEAEWSPIVFRSLRTMTTALSWSNFLSIVIT